MNKEYIIDDNNNIFEVSKLGEDNGVRNFMVDNFTPISRKEIEEDKKDIIESHTDEYGAPKGRMIGYEFVYDYEQDEMLSNLEWLEERLNCATEINLNDENYNKFYNEAKQYGYCG